MEALEDWERAAFCIAQPLCCAPGCELQPTCIFFEEVVTDDGTTECTLDVEGAIEYFLLGGIYLQAGPVDAAMAGTVGQAIPPAWQDFFVALSNSQHMRDVDWLTPAELENVLLVNQDVPTSVLGLVVNGLSTRRGIVFGTHVFLREGPFNYIMDHEPPSFDDLCGQSASDPVFSIVQLLVHELTHVKQYLELTPNGFYANYIYHEGSWTEEGNPLEDEATHVENTVMGRLAACADSEGAELVAGAHALSAWQWLHVNDRAKVRSLAYETCGGDLNVVSDCYAPVSGGGWLGVGANATVGNLLSAGPIQLRSRCDVEGDVTSASYVELQQDARVEGSIYPHAPINYEDDFRYYSPALPSPGTTTVWIGNNQHYTLPPGNYGSLVVNAGATVDLAPGDYYFRILQTEPNSDLVLDTTGGPTRLFIADTLMHKGHILADPSSVLVSYLGQSDVHLEGELNGTLVAPKAFVNVQSRNVGFGHISHSGAIYARAIELHQDTLFQHRYFPYGWEP